MVSGVLRLTMTETVIFLDDGVVFSSMAAARGAISLPGRVRRGEVARETIFFDGAKGRSSEGGDER